MDVYIIGGGSLDELTIERLISTVPSKDRAIIACDRGAETCLKLGLHIDYCVGDFDSAAPGTFERLKSLGITVRKLNPIKDDTDAESALNYAMDNFDGNIYFLGCTGTRLDHVLGNIALIGMCKKRGRSLTLFDKTNKIYMLSSGDSLNISKEKQYGKYISIIPYMGTVKAVTMEGFKYPLDKATIEGFNTLTVSNEIVHDKAKISVGDGYLIVIESMD